MIKEMVEAFVDAKMEGAEMSVALYRVATDVGRHALIKQVNQQSRKAAEAMPETAPVVKSPLAQSFQRWRARGSLLEVGPSPATVRKARE